MEESLFVRPSIVSTTAQLTDLKLLVCIAEELGKCSINCYINCLLFAVRSSVRSAISDPEVGAHRVWLGES